MTDDAANKVKIRIKFRSGEEFEAEGSPDFIEKQRADFLSLIGKEKKSRSSQPAAPASAIRQQPFGENDTYSERRETTAETWPRPGVQIAQQTDYPAAAETEEFSAAPAALRRSAHQPYSMQDSSITRGEFSPSKSSQPESSYPAATPEQQNAGSPQAQTNFSAPAQRNSGFMPLARDTSPMPPNAISAASFYSPAPAPYTPQDKHTDEIRLWEEIVRTEQNMVFLRRKSRLLSAETAALLLLGAAKILLQQSGYGALALSKSLHKSGYGSGRLDRVLYGEMKRGNVVAYGSKRSRIYSLSDEGFAKAFVLAGKLAEEWH